VVILLTQSGSFLNPIDYIFPLYLSFFGLMMITAEVDIQWIKDYCGFLRNYVGRGIFNIYCASLCLYYSFNNSGDPLVQILGDVGCIVFSVVGLFFISLGLFTCNSSSSTSDVLLDKVKIQTTYRILMNLLVYSKQNQRKINNEDLAVEGNKYNYGLLTL